MDNAQQKLRSLDERIEARVQAIRAERDWWPCRRGCDHCCRQLAQPPELTAEEWVRVDAAVAAQPNLIRAEIERKINALLVQITEGNISSKVVCPFLDEQEGACRIYASRPIACRTYGFFVGRDHDQYCQLVEAEVASHSDQNIVWGSAKAIQHELKQISELIPFHIHYQ